MKLTIKPSKFSGIFTVKAGRNFVGNIFVSGNQFEANGKMYNTIEEAVATFA